MSTSALTSMLVYILSIALGVIVFYIVSNWAKEQKIKQAGEVISQIINFVLFMWLSKVILNLPLLFRDPLALLAYPSNSKAFYLAILFSAAVLLYGVNSGRIKGQTFIRTLWHILLPAAFFYEFAQLAWFGDAYAFGNLILYAVLLGLFFGVNDRLSFSAFSAVLLSVWTGGMLLNASLGLFPSTFGYTMEPWFIIFFLTATQFLILLTKKRRPTNERY